MAEENKILIRTNPTIAPSLISFADFESTAAADKGRKIIDGNKSRYLQQQGRTSPLIKIGNAILPDKNLRGLIVRQDSLVPEITLTFTDDNFNFTTRSYPLSNIIVGIFIRSNVKTLKSFAGDFIINTISSIPIPGTGTIVYTLSGELYIPKLYGNYSKAYRNMSSTRVLQKVAEELQLGFADNQTEGTEDMMTWINPNDTYHDFINQIARFCYKNDNSFFDCFIDRYYTLNFVNVEKQFARDNEIDMGYISRDQSNIDKRRIDPQHEQEDDVQVPIILTNFPDYVGSEFFITDFNLTSNHGEILKKHAVRKYTYWYEHGSATPTKETEPTKILEDPPFRLYYLDPLTSSITNDGKLPHTAELDVLKPIDENDPGVTQGVWAGVDYGNAHASYKFAELLNHHNRLETEKNLLEITLSGFSVNIMRGSRVRVEIFLNKRDAMLANVLTEDYDPNTDAMPNQMQSGNIRYDSSQNAMIEDKALSDFYYVKSITYHFRDGDFSTHLILSRRHWLLPLAKNQNNV